MAVARVNMNLRRRLTDPLLGNLVMILAPFTAYLLAELIEASGVLAVVVSGLIMSQSPHASSGPNTAPRHWRSGHWPPSSSTARCSSWSGWNSSTPSAT
ncbi:cation:proton antiporter [Streptomyces sp. NPDC001795]|uniref:cation:proton antiporter domain-containing protein n=1 Tax=unclassified Streptomyces TaxID=2593676 RepID=UPI00331A9753